MITFCLVRDLGREWAGYDNRCVITSVWSVIDGVYEQVLSESLDKTLSSLNLPPAQLPDLRIKKIIFRPMNIRRISDGLIRRLVPVRTS